MLSQRRSSVAIFMAKGLKSYIPPLCQIRPDRLVTYTKSNHPIFFVFPMIRNLLPKISSLSKSFLREFLHDHYKYNLFKFRVKLYPTYHHKPHFLPPTLTPMKQPYRVIIEWLLSLIVSLVLVKKSLLTDFRYNVLLFKNELASSLNQESPKSCLALW